MKVSTVSLAALAYAGSALAAPLVSRQAQPCFLIGTETLPKETADIAARLASTITCDPAGTTTLSGVPDVAPASNSLTFSSISFAESAEKSTLAFALFEFATAEPLASSDLQLFEDALDVYLATEAGIRSVGGNLAIKVPKFFLEFQISRIRTAQGDPPAEPGLQVDHLRDKVLTNAAGQDQKLLDQVTELAKKLS